MRKLNFGCGSRIADGWINMDVRPSDSRVRRVNLLRGFPFPDNHFDAAYSSHVLEHFTRGQALFLLREANRVLKPTGTLRVVVPDLEGTCKEYLRILALPDGDDKHLKPELYEWIVIELLDQLVRSHPAGEMGKFVERIGNGDSEEMVEYVRSRTENALTVHRIKPSFSDRLRKLTFEKLLTKATHWYLKCVGRLLPKHLRSMALNETSIGERHRWMYDFYGLNTLCRKAGFIDCKSVAYNESAISGFNMDFLDRNPDGASYKNNSIYLEASPDPEPPEAPGKNRQ